MQRTFVFTEPKGKVVTQVGRCKLKIERGDKGTIEFVKNLLKSVHCEYSEYSAQGYVHIILNVSEQTLIKVMPKLEAYLVGQGYKFNQEE